jgi:hypothetical protein
MSKHLLGLHTIVEANNRTYEVSIIRGLKSKDGFGNPIIVPMVTLQEIGGSEVIELHAYEVEDMFTV